MSVMGENDTREGTGYVGRVKDPFGKKNIHHKTDLLHVAIYEDPDVDLDYLDVKAIVEKHNNLVFYTQLLDKKNRETFTGKQCQEALVRHPPVGTQAVLSHEQPLSFPQFIELGYEKNILTDSVGYKFYQSKINPPTSVPLPSPSGPAAKMDSDLQAVQSGIETAKEFQGQSGSLDASTLSSSVAQLTGQLGGAPHLGANVVLGDTDLEYGELSLECWKSRALTAENKVDKLEENLVKKDDEINDLKMKLTNCGNAKERFNANADLAPMRLKEFQSASAAPVVEGLKPHLSTLPTILAGVGGLVNQVKLLETLPNLVQTLSTKLTQLGDLPGIIEELQQASKDSTERLESFEENRSLESESTVCFQSRLTKLLAGFGIKTGAETFDVPGAINEILVNNRRQLPTALFTCDCGCGQNWTSLDTSMPPPPVPGQQTSSNPTSTGMLPSTRPIIQSAVKSQNATSTPAQTLNVGLHAARSNPQVSHAPEQLAKPSTGSLLGFAQPSWVPSQPMSGSSAVRNTQQQSSVQAQYTDGNSYYSVEPRNNNYLQGSLATTPGFGNFLPGHGPGSQTRQPPQTSPPLRRQLHPSHWDTDTRGAKRGRF